MRTTPEECARARPPDRQQARGRDGARRALFVPLQGVSVIATEGGVFHDAERGRGPVRAASARRVGDVETHWLELDVNDRRLRRRDGRPAARADPGARHDARPRRWRGCARRSTAGNADHRRRRGHGPLGEVRGGGRRRPDHHLQLGPLPHGRPRLAGGLLPYGDANAIVVDMAREVLPVVRETPVLAGVCGTDPFRLMPVFLDELKRIGFSGVQNFPTVGLFDGTFRAEPRGDRHGLRARGRHDPPGARARPADRALRLRRRARPRRWRRPARTCSCRTWA